MKRIFLYPAILLSIFVDDTICARNNCFDNTRNKIIDDIFYKYYGSIEHVIDRNNPKTGPSAITWKPNGGRFGDNLVSYCKAKWIAYMFNIELLYLPFPYSDELMIHENEKMYTEEE